MPLMKFKPTSAGRRSAVRVITPDLHKGAPHAAAVYSCTAALHLAMLASNVGEGDEVITTPMTFCASVNAIIHTGATPVLADVDPRTMNIDPARIAEKITPRTKAVVPVHFAGRACDMDAIGALCEEHGLMIIEDCAHAIETTWNGRHAGTFGDFGCFSFYVTKNVVTGEGGIVVARTPEQAPALPPPLEITPPPGNGRPPRPARQVQQPPPPPPRSTFETLFGPLR